MDKLKVLDYIDKIVLLANSISNSTRDTYPYGGDVQTWEGKKGQEILNLSKELRNEFLGD